MLEKFCDILVIGTELPGLVTAAFLARRGLSVQVIDSDLYADHPLLPDPSCLTSAQSKLLRSLLGRLNVSDAAMQTFLHLQSDLQVIFPTHRIDILSQPLAFADEVEREFPEQQERLKSFYEELARLRHQTDVNELFQHLIPNSWGERRQFKKFIAQHHLDDRNAAYQEILDCSPEMRAFFKAQLVLGLQSLCEEPFSYQVAELFNPGDGEIFSVIAGQKRLKQLLLDRVTHHDGLIRAKTSVNQLLFRNGVFEGVELSGSTDSILAKYVVWNTSLPQLATLLPKKWRFRGLRKACGQFETSYHWFTARFKTHKNFIPEMLGKNVVLIDKPEKDLVGENFVYLQVAEQAVDETVTIDASFLLPKSALEESNAFFTPYFERIGERLKEVMPFSEKALHLVFPLENEQKDEDTLFPLHEDDFEVFKHAARSHGLLAQNEKRFADLFPLNFKTAAPNLFVTHPHVFAAFGLESKLSLGLKITDIIWQEAEKEKKRAMKAERRIA